MVIYEKIKSRFSRNWSLRDRVGILHLQACIFSHFLSLQRLIEVAQLLGY